MLPVCSCLARRSLSPDSGVAAILSSLTQSPGEQSTLFHVVVKQLNTESRSVVSELQQAPEFALLTGYEPCALTASRHPYPPVYTLYSPPRVSPRCPRLSPAANLLCLTHFRSLALSFVPSSFSPPFFAAHPPFFAHRSVATSRTYPHGAISCNVPQAHQSQLPAMVA